MTTYPFPAKPDTKSVEELRQQHNYDYNFWRSVPEALWNAFFQPDLDWWARTIGFARGLEKTGTLTIYEKWTPAELDALFAVAVSGQPGIEVNYPTHQPATLEAFVARATTDELAIALDASCSNNDVSTLIPAFSATQMAAIKRARLIEDVSRTDNNGLAGCKLRRWYSIVHTDITEQEFAAMATLGADKMLPGGILDPENVAKVRRHLSAVRPALRAWVARELEGQYALSPESSGIEPRLVLWAAALEGPGDELVAPVSARLGGDKATYRKERSRERMAAFLGGALVAAAHGDGVLAALRAATKDKGTLDMLERAGKILATNLGKAGMAQVSWVAMDPESGREILAKGDAAKEIADALEGADGNVALRVFLATALYIRDTKKDRLGGAEWKTLKAIFAVLDQTAGDSLPDTIVRPAWGKRTVDEVFAWAWELARDALTTSDFASKPMGADELRGELQALHDRSTNERFRGLLKVVLGESDAAKLRRLAAACDLKKGTVTRWFAERTDEKSGNQDINRLYGSPIGVSAQAWPMTKANGTKESVPMQHVMTLEARALSPAAQAALGDVAAVALFMEDLRDATKEFALVHLSHADLAQAHEPVVAPTVDGVKLVLHDIEMPKAAFLGGRKTGPLKELREALDHLGGLLSTDKTSARWIQDPEPDGELIVELNEAFASEVNFGDLGAIYVMTGGVVFQCH